MTAIEKPTYVLHYTDRFTRNKIEYAKVGMPIRVRVHSEENPRDDPIDATAILRGTGTDATLVVTVTCQSGTQTFELSYASELEAIKALYP